MLVSTQDPLVSHEEAYRATVYPAAQEAPKQFG
jgi:hypothetical protein